MTNELAFERECDAARDRWEKLSGEEIAEVIDHLGNGHEAIQTMLFLARKNFESDAYEILHSIYILARSPESAQELHDFIGENHPILKSLIFDKYARLAAEELKIHEAWIEGEADAVLNFPETDDAFDSARDEGRI